MRSQTLLAAALAGQALAMPFAAQRRSWPSITSFISKITQEFSGINETIEDACGLITDGEGAVADFFGIPDSESQPCADVTFLFARGTCDTGNLGIVVGPWVMEELQNQLGGTSLATQGLAYPASVDGYLSDDPSAGQTMAAFVKTTVDNCPDSKIVLGGYSQGSMVVHNAAADLDADTMSRISAIVLFGDPFFSQPVANIDNSRVKKYCNTGDNICVNGPIITIAHLTYATDASDAASFIVSQL